MQPTVDSAIEAMLHVLLADKKIVFLALTKVNSVLKVAKMDRSFSKIECI